MGFKSGGHQVTMAGDTDVTVVPAPPSGVRRIVKNIVVANRDSGPVMLTLKKVIASRDGSSEFVILPPTSIAAGGRYVETAVQVLESEDESIVGVLNAAAAATEPDITSAYGDES